MVTKVIFPSCGSSGGGNNSSSKQNYKSYTVGKLLPNTTYYWKVTADDGQGGVTESDTYSFTTGQ